MIKFVNHFFFLRRLLRGGNDRVRAAVVCSHDFFYSISLVHLIDTIDLNKNVRATNHTPRSNRAPSPRGKDRKGFTSLEIIIFFMSGEGGKKLCKIPQKHYQTHTCM